MKNQTTIFIPKSKDAINNFNKKVFFKHPAVNKYFFLTVDKKRKNKNTIVIDSFFSLNALKEISKQCKTKYLLLIKSEGKISFEKNAPERLIKTAEKSNSGIIYSNYFEKEKSKTKIHPVNEYQFGSVRDDFDFGPLLLFNNNILEKHLKEIKSRVHWNGLYATQLSFSRKNMITKLNKYLYSFEESKTTAESKKHFEYLEKENEAKQNEAEKIFIYHLKKIDAYLPQRQNKTDIPKQKNKIEATIIIPVKNREKTIEEALRSALNQKFNKTYNIIVVNNYSTDKTKKIIEKLAAEDDRIIHIIPRRKDLGIGGCWNEAVKHKNCGRFSIQLDSDDIYKNGKTLQKIVDRFYKEKCGMVIGSYQLTDFNLNEIPPGVIAHREWTKNNGHNNALRVNGFGAPRAFLTKLLKATPFPNVSYGEDYAVCLAISRKYKVGRIYEPLYICRRWKGNTDSDISIMKKNQYDYYKDKLRTVEIRKRIKLKK